MAMLHKMKLGQGLLETCGVLDRGCIAELLLGRPVCLPIMAGENQ
jgi:hypothetical protein